MGINVLTTKAEYDLMEVFRAIAYDINERQDGITKQPIYISNWGDAVLENNEKALSILNKWMKAGKDTLVTKTAVPTEPAMGGDPSFGVVAQILNGKMKPKGMRLEK